MNELCVCWLQRSRWSCMCKVRHQQQQWRPAHWLHWCLVSSRVCCVQQYSKLSWRWSLIFSIQFHCSSSKTAFTALTLLVGRQEEHPACKNWVMRCWCGYLSGARCRLLAYGPADATPSQNPFSGTTQVSRYQKGKTNLNSSEVRDSEWQWRQLGHMEVCTLLQTDNHANTSPLSFLQAGCPPAVASAGPYASMHLAPDR